MRRSQEWSRLGSSVRRSLKRQLIERDGTKCHHCGVPTVLNSGDDLQTTVDHWPVPKRDLPKREWTDPSRCVIACYGCNNRLNHEAQTGGRIEQP